MNDIEHYLTPSGEEPYQQWLERLKDKTARARISTRVTRLAANLPGDCKPIANGVWELRIDHGPGYRIYYARAGKRLILLLLGADKRRQQVDIERALGYWADYLRRDQ
jgi:putative addiction module killer protein